MRYLTIVRHCEATPNENDFVRTLTERGRRQAEEIRDRVLDPEQLGQYGPVTALVSAAARTRETYALAFAGTIKESLLVVGHFPWVWQLVSELTEEMPDAIVSDYPVGTAVVLALPDNEHVGLRHYEVAAVFLPTI